MDTHLLNRRKDVIQIAVDEKKKICTTNQEDDV